MTRIFNKKLYIITAIVFLAFCLFTGGINILYLYQYNCVRTSSDGCFSPRLYISSEEDRIIIIPGILYIIRNFQPQNIYISKNDESFERKHEGFDRVQIDQLDIIYDDGKVEHIISTHSNLRRYDFNIHKSEISADVIIPKIIYRNTGFTIKMTGKAIRKDLSTSNFKRENVYKGETIVKIYFAFWCRSQGS